MNKLLSTQDAGAAGFSILLENLAQLDFFTLVLPFVLSYIVFFLAVKQLDLFERQHAALIAVISSFFTAQFIATNPFYQTFFIEYFGQLTIGLAGLLGLFVLLGLVGWKRSVAKGPFMGIIVIAITGAAFTSSGGFGPPAVQNAELDLSAVGPLLFDTGLIWILVIGAVILWISKDDSDNGGGGGSEPGLKDFIEWGLGEGGN